MSKVVPSESDRELPNEAAPNSLSALTSRNVEVIAHLEEVANSKRSRADVMADMVSNFVGSMLFVYIHVAWFTMWIGWNVLASSGLHFDPYPFTFLTFVVSLEAIFLSTFILISQNHEEHLARRRNHLDLQINLLSEQENSHILKMLSAIHSHLNIGTNDCKGLEEDVEPEKLVSKIEEVIETDKK